MRANKQSAVQLKTQLLLTAAILVLLTACNGTGTPGDGITNGDGDGDGTPGSGFVTGGGGISADEFCNSPWVEPSAFCGSGGAVFSARPTCGNDDQAGIVDACGLAITTLDLHDPVVMTMTGLTANTRHIITITDPLTADITSGGYTVTSDADGEINKATIVQNMAVLPGSELGLYTVSVATVAAPGTEVQNTTYTVEDRSRVQCVDGSNTPRATFLAGDTVYARVTNNTGSLADGTYDVYIQNDLGTALATGLSMGSTALTVTVAGGAGSVDLGNTFIVGSYDVVVDVDNDGIFDQGSDLISRHNRLHPCFSVQTANVPAAIMREPIASDKNGNKREIFDPNANIPAIRDIQAFLTPVERSSDLIPGSARTYLVAHQNTWTDLDTLNDADVASQFKTGPIQDQTNSEAPWLLTPYSSFTALGDPSGCYDVVIDTNRDGVFDAGMDYVDNVNHLGDNTDCGVRISTASCTDVTITSHTDGTYLATETAITLAGVISNSPATAYVTITSGTQTNTVQITPDGAGNYSTNLPLFAGDNHITVSGIYGDNSSCSQTITISRPTNVALFRAQLTWEQNGANDYDMDLHLVKPGGTYSNGGGGDGTDCNYANCKVGLNGELAPNSIDWGVAAVEEDDPSLDVDCIGGCDRIENIWMSFISNDGAYQVYVDAWNAGDIGDNVTVTISILGTTVGQVNCGYMEAETANDSCFVGTINWVGGSAGTGTFTPVGTKQADFP